MATLTATVHAGISALQRIVDALGTTDDAIGMAAPIRFESGTGNGKIDLCYRKQRSLVASASEELDLRGVLSDIFGSTLELAKVKTILIAADPANAHNIRIGNAASTQFVAGFGAAGNTWDITPGDVFLVTNRNAGWTAANGASDKLKVANTGGVSAVIYSIIILAASA